MVGARFIPPPALPVDEFSFEGETDDADAARNRHLQERMRGAARQAALDPDDGIFLSPDGSERMEGAIGRRLDRLSRQADRLAWNVELGSEALALFVRFWLTSAPPLPDAARPAAQAQGRERYGGFIDALMRRMETETRLARDVAQDVTPGPGDEHQSLSSSDAARVLSTCAGSSWITSP